MPITEERINELESLEQNFQSEYPVKKAIRVFHQTIGFNQEGEHTSSDGHSVFGYQFWAAGEQELITCRKDGFSYHKLKPYSKWSEVLQNTLKNWEVYRSKIDPHLITKFSVRNINLIEIPHSKFDEKEYFECAPKLPLGIDRPLEGFLTRLAIDFAEVNAKYVVTMAPQLSFSQTSSFILLDIEAFRITNIQINNEQISNILTDLNHIKHVLFFGSLTDKAKELFE